MTDREALSVAFFYHDRDKAWRDELETHLAFLKRGGKIRTWHDLKITASDEWQGAIDDHLESADVILLLVSPAFIASDYCWDLELGRAMERHEAGDARVIPIILRPVDWHDAPFGKLQGLPKDARPVTTWPNRDQAYLDIARGLRAAIEEELHGTAQSPPRADISHSSPSGGTPAVRARSIKAKHVAGVQIQGIDVETAARLAGAGIEGEVTADEIDAESVAGLQLLKPSKPEP